MIVVIASPMPGTSPIRASRPKRIWVPGIRNAVSIKVASASMRAMRCSRDRSNEKVAVREVTMNPENGDWIGAGKTLAALRVDPAIQGRGNFPAARFIGTQHRLHRYGRRHDNGEAPMKTLLISAAALLTAAVLTPASAQIGIDTPVGGVRIGEPGYRHYRCYDRPVVRERRIYRERGVGLNCRTVTVERDDGSMRRIRRCD